MKHVANGPVEVIVVIKKNIPTKIWWTVYVDDGICSKKKVVNGWIGGERKKESYEIHAAGIQSLSNPAAQGAFKGEVALNWLIDPDLVKSAPLTVPNNPSISITVPTDPDPIDPPKDRTVLFLSGVTCTQGGDPIVGNMDGNGGSSKGERLLLSLFLLLLDKGDRE